MAILAVQTIRKLRGGAQSQLMLGADGNLWVVKFQNNPQHLRVLANELMATRLAEAMGLTVPKTDIVDVSPWLIENSPEMNMEYGRGRVELCSAGLQFGSQYIGGLTPGQTLDYLPEEKLREVRNIKEFAGMLVLDKWTGNANGRQAVFHKKPRERAYRATFIDQGYCFTAGEWVFSDTPLRGVYQRNSVYESITGWESFEPWLSLAETMEEQTIWEIAEAVPPEWYGGHSEELEVLMKRLLKRRDRIRELIHSFGGSSRNPFPYWGKQIYGDTLEQTSSPQKYVM